MTSPEPSPTPLILDLDQHLHRSALLEAIQLLDCLIRSLSPESVSIRFHAQQVQLRLTYLALHCRTSSEIQSEIRSLHRMAHRDLALSLESQLQTLDQAHQIISGSR